MLVCQLLISPLAEDIWSRPIGQLIPRVPHITSYTDVFYKVLGGCCSAFNFISRISSADLASLGWLVITTKPERYLPFPEGEITHQHP